MTVGLTALPSAEEVISLRKGLSIRGKGHRGPYHISPSILLMGSEEVFLNGQRIYTPGYWVDYNHGQILFVSALSESDSVMIEFDELPLDVPHVLRRRDPPEVAEEMPLVAKVDRNVLRTPSGFSKLETSGSKTIGVSFGSGGDISVEQSLRVNMNGKIGKDVSVTAFLSDQNLGLTPAGDTEELEAIDKVWMEIASKNFGVVLGDYELKLRGNSFANYRKELSGITGNAVTKVADFGVSAARSKGVFSTKRFRGTDGKQGPYLLTGAAGERSVSIVPGSEEVWVNGGRVLRGENRDYIIDYSNGTIHFTENVPVTTDTEVTVDYEYSNQDFARNIYSAEVRRSVGSIIDLETLFIQESDDRGSPIASLSDSDREILARAGDDSSMAWASGVRKVGAGYGDYDSLATGHFEYAGENNGEYTLNFERVSGGDYIQVFDEQFQTFIYKYVGDGEGDYSLGRRLPFASSALLGSVKAAAELGEWFDLSGEVALSSFDKNTFSVLDEGDNDARATSLSGAVMSPEVRIGHAELGRLRLESRFREVESDFHSLGRIDDASYFYRWDLEGERLGRGELLRVASVSWEKADAARLTYELGEIERAGRVTGRRSVTGALGAAGVVAVNLESTRIEGESNAGSPDARSREIDKVGFTVPLRPVSPSLGFWKERRVRGDDGSGFREFSVGVAADGMERTSFNVRFAGRDLEAYEGAWRGAGGEFTQEYSLSRAGSNTAARLKYFQKLAKNEGGETKRYDLASLQIDRSGRGVLDWSLDYQISSTEAQRLGRELVKTGESEGEDDSDGEYVGAGNGDYTYESFLHEHGEAVSEVELSGRARIRLPSRGGPVAGGFIEVFGLVEERSAIDDKLALYLLKPDVLQRDDTTIDGETLGRALVRLHPGNLSNRIEASYERRDIEDNRFVGNREERFSEKTEASGKLGLGGGWGIGANASYGRRLRRTSTSGLSEYDIDEKEAGLLLSMKPEPRVRADLSLSIEQEVDKTSGSEARLLGLQPSVTISAGGRASLRAELIVQRVSSGDSLPGYIFGGLRTGANFTWNVDSNLRVSDHVTLTIDIYGRKRPQVDAYHKIDARLNAYF
jgi:hypothetical protein